jgi:hypothetical protein
MERVFAFIRSVFKGLQFFCRRDSILVEKVAYPYFCEAFFSIDQSKET